MLPSLVARSHLLTLSFRSLGVRSSLKLLNGTFRSQSTEEKSGKGAGEKSDKSPAPLASPPTAPINLPGEEPAVKEKGQVTSHLTLHKSGGANVSCASEADRPLVLLFQWLYAKPQNVQKYCALYHDIGLDVLAVRGKLSHFLWPPVGVQLSAELFKYLKEHRPPNEKILIHAFSVGAYNYTLILEAAAKSPENSGMFRDRIVGQIFDSIVIGSYEKMSRGIAEVLPNNKAFRQVVLQTLNVYYSVTQTTTKDTYERLVQHFKEEPIAVPTLVFYAENDPMCDVAAMEQMLSQWKTHQPPIDVTKVSWSTSVHALHLREHREMYLAAWKGLMERLKLM